MPASRLCHPRQAAVQAARSVFLRQMKGMQGMQEMGRLVAPVTERIILCVSGKVEIRRVTPRQADQLAGARRADGAADRKSIPSIPNIPFIRLE